MAHCSDTGKGDKLMNSTVAAATKPSNTNNKIKHSTGENVGTFLIYLVVALFALICVLPFVLVIIVSFSSEKSITINGYSFWPSEWSAAAYKMLFLPSSSVPQSYLVTTIATVFGTVVASFVTFGAGYTLANRSCRYRDGLSLYFYITMVFSAGLVPWYMMCKMLNCYDNIWALIVPSLMFNPFNMFLVRNFVRGIPAELNESAKIDGAGEVKIAFGIYFPLCMPVLATIALFYAIGYWNNYFNAVMLVNDEKYYSLQMLLFKIQSQITALSKLSAGDASTSDESSATEDDGTIHPMRIVQPGTLCPDYETGMAAVNEKLKEDGVNIEVSVTRIPWDAYAEKLNLMLTTGEEFELLHVMQDVKNLSAIAGMGAISSIHDSIQNYPDLYNKFSETEWLGTLYKGEEYAVPCYWRSFDNTMSYMDYRSDIAEKVGYDEFPDTTEGIIDLMKKSQDEILNETGMKAYSWFHQAQDTAHWLHRSYDTYPFYVENSLGICLIRQDGTVDSFYESEEFKKDANTYYEMYQAGLIDPDILNRDHQKQYDDANYGAMLPSQTFDPYTGVTMQKNGVEGAEVKWVEAFGDDIPDMIYTYVQNLNAISSTSEDPESGLKFLNWLYASEENHDLFHYGIEGTHYTKTGDHRIEQVKGDDGNPLYSMDTWMTGYLPYMAYATDTPDEQVDYMTYKSDNYVISPAAGFIFDSSNVTSELTNLQTEIISSIYPIKVGMVSYEDNIDAAIEKLKAAGLDKYMEEYRTQFKAYLDANPNVLEIAKGTTEG